MTTDYGSTRSLSAMFDTRAEADRAVAALMEAGIADAVLTGGENQGYGSVATDPTLAENRDRGFFEQLGDFFFPDEDRYTYAEGLNRGAFLVTVDNIPPDQYERALDILDDEGAVDLDAREAEWRSEGWTNDPMVGSMAAATTTRDEGLPGTVASRTVDRAADALTGDRTYAADRTYAEDDLNRDGKIDIVEERLSIAKREQELGRVRVRSYVKETPVEETVNLREEHVSIERRPVDRAATDADFRDQSVEAREYAEEAVVNKEARVVEEIALKKEQSSRDQVVRDSVRKTEVEVVDERNDSLRGGVLRDEDKI
ncbi:DUF2382 domain-containing protein [Paracoccus suum]|uniref:DUF2382 domain-containing protein n=2 Tax=Paracoccus suum TaxID=2259340 RepID=A0A344PNP0_9RHOB|nr:DUF2382 domain-containing protein [Paracoccus suum]